MRRAGGSSVFRGIELVCQVSLAPSTLLIVRDGVEPENEFLPLVRLIENAIVNPTVRLVSALLHRGRRYLAIGSPNRLQVLALADIERLAVTREHVDAALPPALRHAKPAEWTVTVPVRLS